MGTSTTNISTELTLSEEVPAPPPDATLPVANAHLHRHRPPLLAGASAVIADAVTVAAPTHGEFVPVPARLELAHQGYANPPAIQDHPARAALSSRPPCHRLLHPHRDPRLRAAWNEQLDRETDLPHRRFRFQDRRRSQGRSVVEGGAVEKRAGPCPSVP